MKLRLAYVFSLRSTPLLYIIWTIFISIWIYILMNVLTVYCTVPYLCSTPNRCKPPLIASVTFLYFRSFSISSTYGSNSNGYRRPRGWVLRDEYKRAHVNNLQMYSSRWVFVHDDAAFNSFSVRLAREKLLFGYNSNAFLLLKT